MPRRVSDTSPFEDNPLWYKDAIIYEVHVRAFADSDADGVGDFTGLTEKLDYLEDLGITALWLLPFYPSPLRDDGYDISDYYNIQPVYGTMANFKDFVDEAHRHNIRVITELVVNHTSDQHPWFQRARKSPKGTRYRDFYVWSDTPEKYRETRIIFKDYETSNWSWDPVVKEYYWHRFYYHQPDLNFDNPATRSAISRVMDFWLKLGVDGLRVDAVPYLFEREGTNCENLPETHQFVKELRAHFDKRFRNRMLLAEANQWPEDAAAYFGKGDEFHMAFNFPIMPRLFMALRMEDRFPIIDILQQTPSIPDPCQWALFLRNHDELTLEMVTDEERDYMYRVYASDPTARINLGIRRRLAPLLGNDRKKIELMNSLLFSLPGTPVIYYGDEIGMGDNFYLGDRNGVRTPMQWSPERNAGFSRANPQRLFLPPIIDPEYHYEAINVENQANNTDSLLWWMKRVISLRKRYKAFGRGSIQFLQPENRKVLAYLRRHEGENILAVTNLSHNAQQTQLDLHEFAGHRPVDLFGRAEFVPITESGYFFTLSPHAFYWFSLEPLPADSLRLRALPSEEKREVPVIKESEESLFGKKVNWFVLEAVLLHYIRGRRWFRGKAREAWATEIQDIVPMRFDNSTAYLTLMEVEYSEGEPETYCIPLMTVPADWEGEIVEEQPQAIVARLRQRGKAGKNILVDAMVIRDFTAYLLPAIRRRRSFKGTYGEVTASPTRFLRRSLGPGAKELEPIPMKVEQSNTSLVYGNQLVLKLYRRLEEGLNPDVEIGRFLTENTPFANISQVAGSLEYHRGRRRQISLAILQGYISNEGDAWQYTLDFMERYFEGVLAHATVQAPPIPRKPLLSLLKEPPALAKDTIGTYMNSAQLLGQRTAELHIALASGVENIDFAPEPFTTMYQTSLYQSLRGFAIRTLQLLRERLRYLPEDCRGNAKAVLDLQDTIIERYNRVRRGKITATRIRCHGDYHLGQLLFTGKDFVIIDFEGEPARSLSERRLKRSPLRDVAGMIRSFHYAAHTALLKQAPQLPKPEDILPLLKHWAQYWYVWVSVDFLNTYLDIIGQTGLLPEDPDQLKTLLDAFLLDKAIYEVGYELNNRPDWVKVPLEGIIQLIEWEG
ncbi:MAG TPA: maltose alpha-D-glucosyltransferase [Dehalococcoidales bacterium]|nr:MAG: maltose alpha-D-glucosyltransferase [Chloroflexi bacterium RBG_16_60_22]HJX12553.1 maltose alpha-D-glucosyltransferase [Dehalococcoidales bacterium]